MKLLSKHTKDLEKEFIYQNILSRKKDQSQKQSIKKIESTLEESVEPTGSLSNNSYTKKIYIGTEEDETNLTEIIELNDIPVINAFFTVIRNGLELIENYDFTIENKTIILETYIRTNETFIIKYYKKG